jgi:hypothetical protein
MQRLSHIRVDLTPYNEVYAHGEIKSNGMENIVLTGFKRWSNCTKRKSNSSKEGECSISLTTVAGVHTITLTGPTGIVAQGSTTNSTADVVMTAVNGSGVSGTIGFNFDHDCDGTLVILWPSEYKIYWKTSPWEANPATTANGVLYDNGSSNAYVFRSNNLPPGNYWVLAHQKIDGVESTNWDSGGTYVQILAIPNAPTNLKYVDGDGGYTRVSFTNSTSVGATYNLYDSTETGMLNLSFPSQTLPAGAVGATTIATLETIDGSFTGQRQVLVRATYDTQIQEEVNANVIIINYVNGMVINLPPQQPNVSTNITQNGRTVSLSMSVSPATPIYGFTKYVHIYLYKIDATPDFLQPDATSDAFVSNDKPFTTRLSAIAPSDGAYYFIVRAESESGILSEGYTTFGPIQMTLVAPPSPIYEVPIEA